MVKEDRIREILTEASSLDEATERLVTEANEAGGRDNITVIAFRLEQGEEAETPEPDATLVGPDRRRRRTQRRAGPRGRPQPRAPGRRGLGARLAPRRTPPAALAHGAEGARGGRDPGRDRRRRGARRAPGLLPRDRRGRPPRALPRAALRAAVRHRALQRGALLADPDRVAARGPPRRGHQPRAALARRRRRPPRRPRAGRARPRRSRAGAGASGGNGQRGGTGASRATNRNQ